MRSGFVANQTTIEPLANLMVESSVVTDNGVHGFSITDSQFSIRNSYIGQNTVNGINFGLAQITSGIIALELSTIAANGVRGVGCNTTVVGPDFLVRGNVVVDNQLSGTTCDEDNLFVFNQSFISGYDFGTLNNVVDLDFVGGDDYRQILGSEGIDWSGAEGFERTTDEDADGKPRLSGASVDLGAFEFDPSQQRP